MGFKIVRSSLINEVIAETPVAEYPITEFEDYKRICIEEETFLLPQRLIRIYILPT